MAKKDNLSEKEKQKIKDDYNALYEDGVMDVLKYAGKRELKSIGEGFMPISPEEKDKARAKRSLEFSIDDEKIMNLVQTLKNKLNNIPAELREDAAKQMTRENTSPENYLPFYNLITQQGDYGPEGSKSISLGREIGSQETLPMSELPFNKLPDNEKQKRLSMLQFSVVNPERVEVSKVMSDFKNQYGEEVLAMEIDKIKKDFVAGKLDSFKMAQDNIKPKNMGGLVGYANGGNMSIQQQTQNVANQGRYGDSMLLHVNPAEVKGLAQAMPITVNPETGQPEAFLPFLAPMIGGMLGSSVLTGAAMGSTLFGAAGISSALATGIGAGLTSYAQSGGSGKRALFSALTGYGGAKAAELAGGAAASSADIAANTGNLTTELSSNIMNPNALNAAGETTFNAANVIPGMQLPPGVPPVGPELSNLGNIELQKQLTGFQPALQQSGANAADAFYAGPVDGFRPDLKDSLGQAFSGDGGYPEGFGNLLQGATSQAAYLPMAVGVGGTGLMESEDLYEQQERERMADNEERKRQMYLNNPEPMLYSASGGMTQFEEGGDTDYDSESGKQVFSPAKQQYAVNPNFMAGFAPETMYFRPDTINAEARSSTHGMQPVLGPDTYRGTKGGYDNEGYLDNEGNYVPGTAQGVQFAPQTAIDPYAAYTGIAPDGVTPLPPLQGLVQSEYNPYDVIARMLPPEGSSSSSSGSNTSYSWLDEEEDNQNYADETEGQGGGYLDNNYDPTDNTQMFVDGGPTKKLPNKGLEALNKIAPQVVDNMGYQEGGQTDPLIQEATMFILGESDNEEAINQFIAKYGNDAFLQLRQQILESLVPNAQTEGLIEGVGNGGMDDDIMGTIGGKQDIAVSQDEFIVPADVVSMLGDGSSDAGSKELYSMMDRVRQKKTGTTEQAPKLANAGGMLPA